MTILAEKANGFKFTPEMAMQFDMLLQDDNYG